MDLLNEIGVFIPVRLAALNLSPLYAAISNNVFPGATSEEIVLRSDPSQAVVERYLDGSEEGEQLFSILAKSKTQATARNQLESLKGALDLADMQEITGALFGKMEPVSSVVFVSKSDAAEYVYTVSFRLEYNTVK